ncbi:type IX secretion system sortase PorU [Hymenobacter sp. CRA2]|uniref:type IX secretion system sortase PorU n=1 Tax=Hymenobacter sp. CRA2 TaxID=1955620 RepID=UPI00098F9F0F|nr:type IX secretion system sortase PorU [Hymenobacter sp. CRA2]OON66791.1 hypothetical protein B0919_20700 [Hymenobacter sp. CRA2]
MRLFTLLLVLVSFTWQAHGQATNAPVTLSWSGQATVFPTRGAGVRVPSFTDAVFEPGQRIPSVSLSLDGYVSEVQIVEPRYAAFTTQEAAAFAGVQVPAAAQVTLHHGTSNHQALTLASVTAVRRNALSGQLEKLTSFQYTFRTETPPQARTTRTYATTSALNTGDWFKIGVPSNEVGNGGVFKLDRNFLQALGLPVQSLDPRRLQLYGYGLGMLPQSNRAARPDDLVENAIYFADNGSNNATFDSDEYFLFYSSGPHTWKLQNQQFAHQLNIYTDTAYYFLTVGNTNGRRVTNRPAVSGTPTATIREYTDHFFYEREYINLLHSGRQWLGEGLNPNTSKTAPFREITNLVPGSPLLVTSSVAATSLPGQVFAPSSFGLTLNGTSLGAPQTVRSLSCDPSTPYCYPELANTDVKTYSTLAPAGTTDLTVELTFNGSAVDPSAVGYLDYIEIQARRQLTLGGTPLLFRSLTNVAPNALSTFEVQNVAANTVVWDVTNPLQVQNVAHSSGRFLASTSAVREYVAFTPGSTSTSTPRAFGRVGRQNLHALATTSPVDLLIITSPAFVAQATELGRYRETHDGFHPQVVTTNQIYNEFSSGGQDVTAIRDFIKMIYDRPTGRTGKLYVLLFGDASYDYKSDPSNSVADLPAWWSNRVLKDADNQNYVPTYESISSFAKVGVQPSYCSDDYYGYLDDEEGEWAEDGSASNDMMDAAIGRLPVRLRNTQGTATLDATGLVAKIKAYDRAGEASGTQGKWRNRLTFVADDGDSNLHLYDSETATAPFVQNRPDFQVNKVYLDMYPQLSTSGGQRSPDASAALDAALEQGSLMVSYSGHGGPQGWTDEQILNNASIAQLQNQQRLSFLLTATCDFAWYDDPKFVSAGEQVFTDTPAGAIGLFTTTRLVYSNNNQALASRFYEAQFKRNANGSWPRLGDVIVFGKNNDGLDVVNRNFTLIGDPTMRLALPQLAVRTTRLSAANDPNHAPLDTIRALQRVQLEGEVIDPTSRVLQAGFKGEAQITVYEKPSLVRTLGNENDTVSVRVQRDVIYDGKATVTGGRFSVQFVVPKDINYRYGFGKISFYAYDEQNNVDAHGSSPRVVVGGAAPTALNDTIPPNIRLAMDTEAFVFGGLTKTDTKLIAKLRDASGINTAGTGIGHELTATLDNDPTKVTVLNEFYSADTDSLTRGEVRYLFKNLTVGPHVLRVKAWDTFNNSSEKEIEFIVAKNDKMALDHVLNYPNPFANHTTFHFDHNRFGEDLDVQVQIFTVSGKLVRTLIANIPNSDSHVRSISWDGRDDYNDQLARGVYVYRISVRTSRDAQVSKFEKLVLLN